MTDQHASVFGPTWADPAEASSRIQFRRAVVLAAMTLVLPGSAQMVHGNRKIGRIAVRVVLTIVAVLVAVGLLAVVNREAVVSLAMNPTLLFLGRWLLIALAVAWAALLVDAWRLGRPSRMRRSHAAVSAGLNTAMMGLTVGALFFAAHLVSVMDDFSGAVFTSSVSTDPTAGRYNILLLGSDSGQDRDGMRPDSINVASVDAKTGRAVLIGLPRNLQDVPFPKGSVMGEQFPDGFNCEGCYLNSVNTWANDHAELFDEKEPGIPATMEAVEEITGLKINYYALVNMEGFAKLIDAVGGVTINVRERTAIGGIGSPIRDYIEAGNRKLSGDHALWYARSRVQNDDFSRMGRQKCIINAMVKELSPAKVLMNLSSIADGGKAMLATDIPRSDMDTFANLALKTKAEPISTVSLVPPAIYTGNPDYPKVRRLVAEAVGVSEGKAEYTSPMASAKLPIVDPTAAPKDPKKANQSANLDEAC